MALKYPQERRTESRMNINCAVKLYDPRARRYYAGKTVNVSAGGALVELHQSLGGDAGDTYEIVVDWTQVHPMIGRSEMRPVQMVRRSRDGDGQPLVAMRFAEPQQAIEAA